MFLEHRITASRSETQPADDVGKDVSDSIARGPNVTEGWDRLTNTTTELDIDWLALRNQSIELLGFGLRDCL